MAAADQARVVVARLGIVLSPKGGALQLMLPPFRFGMGGPFGTGQRWTSWLCIDDAVGALFHAACDDTLHGAVNFTAPQPVTNQEMCSELGTVLGRPALLPVPPVALRAMLGQMADETMLSDLKVTPVALQRAGYRFLYPTLGSALRHVLGRTK